MISDEFKRAGHQVWLLQPDYDENDLPVFASVRKVFSEIEQIVRSGDALSVWVCERGGIAEGLFKMGLGSRIGVKVSDSVSEDELFAKHAGAFLIETSEEANMPADARLIAVTAEVYEFSFHGETLEMEELQKLWEEKLQPVFPYLTPSDDAEVPAVSYQAEQPMHASYTCAHPHVLIPVFPGTNCEWDTARAFEKYGADPEIFVIRNRTPQEIEDSVDRFAASIAKSQIIALPGGFSGGDEPDGSGKFITSFFRNPKIRNEVTKLLDEREGLMCGICNGFQALVKLGLVPYGKIMDMDEDCPTLTFNSIGRHQSMLVRTRVASNKSPWLRYAEVGEISSVAISHGEGRFVAEEAVLKQMIENGQIAEQYVDLDGNPTENIRFNPNHSVMAIEGITSPDGRVFGKMGHSERSGDNLYRNIPDLKFQDKIFKGAVDYFR